MYVCEKIITYLLTYLHTHTHTRLTALFSGTRQVSRYQKSDQVNKKQKITLCRKQYHSGTAWAHLTSFYFL